MTSKEKLLQIRHDFYLNDPVNYDSISYFTSIEKDLDKLSQLEDIEEEIGIESIVLFKAIMNGFWFKRLSNYDFVEPYSYVIDLESSRLIQLYEENGKIFYFEDYGKTWALTKEELKNE